MFVISFALIHSVAVRESGEEEEVTRAKYFIRDEFLVSFEYLFIRKFPVNVFAHFRIVNVKGIFNLTAFVYLSWAIRPVCLN